MRAQHNPFFGRVAYIVHRIIGFVLFTFVVKIPSSESETNGKHDHTINIARTHTERNKDRENNKEKSKTFEAKSAGGGGDDGGGGGGECGVHRIQLNWTEIVVWKIYNASCNTPGVRRLSLLNMGNVWIFLSMGTEYMCIDTDANTRRRRRQCRMVGASTRHPCGIRIHAQQFNHHTKVHVYIVCLWLCMYELKLQLRIQYMHGVLVLVLFMITQDAFHKNTLVHRLKYSRQHFHSTLSKYIVRKVSNDYYYSN